MDKCGGTEWRHLANTAERLKTVAMQAVITDVLQPVFARIVGDIYGEWSNTTE